MKIGIEGQRLYRHNKHGMEIVALELIDELQQMDHENEYYVYVRPSSDNDCIRHTANFNIIELEASSFAAWEQFILPKAAARDGCDILHCTSNTAPVNPGMPLIITLHDIIYLEKTYLNLLLGGGSSYQRFGSFYRRYIVNKAVSKADRIITVSNFEKQRIAEYFNLPADDPKLKVIYNGVGRHFKPVTDPKTLQRVRVQYNLPNQYMVFLGNTAPKKNVIGVLKAFSQLMKRSRDEIKLIIIDYSDTHLRKILERIGDPGLEKHIHLTGYVVNTDLPSIITMSRLFLYPSLRESFGIPILEAMQCGTPVITSDTSSMPEISGGNALLVDPFDPTEIFNAMQKILEDEALAKKLSEGGMEHAAGFSWQSMAAAVHRVYQEVYKHYTKD